jgi:hypothetical protein
VLHLHVLISRVRAHAHRLGEHGQATAEYALVLLGVAALALLVLAWAGGTDKIGELLDAVIDSIIDQV